MELMNGWYFPAADRDSRKAYMGYRIRQQSERERLFLGRTHDGLDPRREGDPDALPAVPGTRKRESAGCHP
jgi:hypothetical protein